ncbi:MAG: hypothetical protein AAGG09_01520 [Pseudomonadota bacterium]
MEQRATANHASELSNGILLIPDSLREFSGARAIMTSGRVGIYHKLLERDAFGTEFFSNTPCLAYVMRGREAFFDAEGEETTVRPDDTLLVPRHHHIMSEFQTKPARWRPTCSSSATQ